jgi:hypothetical protein
MVRLPLAEPSVEQGAVVMAGTETWARPGLPLLPVRTVRLLLPPGSELSTLRITVQMDAVRRLELKEVAPAPPQLPIGSSSQAATATKNQDIYGLDRLYPESSHEVLGLQYSYGYPILVLRVFPVRWNPGTGHAESAGSVKIHVRCPGAGIPSAAETAHRRGLESDHRALAALVDNPYYLARLETSTESPGATDWEYLVVTSSAMLVDFQTLADHRALADGLTTHVADIATVLAAYPGRDDAEKLRAFVSDGYQNHGTRYLVLGGDSDIIPVRGCYGRGEVSIVDNNIPTDFYYGALDGDWNADGDGIWGEPEDGVDLLAEVAVGRISAGNATEAARQVAKIIAYESWTAAPFHTLLLGEQADSVPTWGGDMLDYLYLQMGGIPRDTLYDRDGYWSSTTLINTYLNTGTMNTVNHMGHANTTSVMKMGPSDASGLSNPNPFFIYSQGCYSGAFDDGDCMAEYFTVKGSGGCHAVIMNSRYGWYAPGSVLGTSNLFQREFLEAVYEEGTTRLGDANNHSKHELAGLSVDYGSVRWTHFDATLFGDPATPVHWQCTPSAVRVVPESITQGFNVMRSDQWLLSAAIHSDCATDVTATMVASFSNGDGAIYLVDDGVAPDQVADDGHYSGTWVPGTEGPVTVSFTAVAPGLSNGTATINGNVVPWMGYLVTTDSGAWIDTSAGTTLPASSILGTTDDGGWIISPGFPFAFYGVTYNDMMVGSNGYILLEHGASYAATEESQPIPYAGDENGLLAPWWCDLALGSGSVRTLLQGSSPSRVFTVEWSNVPHYPSQGGATFQVSLYETSNEIVFRYQDTDLGDPDYDHGADATIGIEGPNGVHAAAFAYHEPVLVDGLVVSFSPISSAGQLLLDRPRYGCSDTITVRLLDSDLEGQPSVTVAVASDTEATPEDLVLVPDGDPRIFVGSIDTGGGAPVSDGVLQVTPDDTVTVTYDDANPVSQRTATATIDCAAPAIFNLGFAATHNSVTVTWETDEPSTGAVLFGQLTPTTVVDEGGEPGYLHSVVVGGLTPCTSYLFDVIAADICGNQSTDDNGGLHYSRNTYGWSENLLAGGNLDSDPEWTIYNGGSTLGWAFGQPTGGGGEYGAPDPVSGHTGSNVYGVNLSGDYENGLSTNQLRLLTPVLDCSELSTITLGYWRWLGIEQPAYDHARVMVSINDAPWVQVWENIAQIDGGSWVWEELDLTALAAGQSNVRVRWSLGSTDGSWRFAGWNIDDIELAGATECSYLNLIFADGFESGDVSAWSEVVAN